MKRAVLLLALAFALVMTGCASKAKPTPTPNPAPAATLPTTVGATRYAQGPGLVVEGYTPLKQIHVELKQGNTVLQKADVSPKDDGWYRITWQAPESAVAEVVVSDMNGKVLARGALSTQINVGLFYGGNASAVQVDVFDKAMTVLVIQGRVKTTDGKFWIQLRDGDKVLSSQEVTLSNEFGTFNGKWPMVPGARTVWILTGGGKQMEVGVPIVTH